MNFEAAVGIVRMLIDQGISRDDAINNQAIPEELRAQIRERLEREEIIILEPARMIVAERREDWLRNMDRSIWYYWPTLRQHLLRMSEWPAPVVRSLDEATDRILGQLAHPATEQFDIRGLVLGYVQSGKTANYTTLIAKAADVGYRLFIVLSGIDNGLRLQTQSRLKRELVGYDDRRPNAVPMPPIGRQWHEFTRDELDGDFRPGYANSAALQGSQPVLLVIKKNGTVMRRLRAWLDIAPEQVRRLIPLLVIDDEADLASVDTRGTYQAEDESLPEDYEPPSVINGLIREILTRFAKRAYVAYTATPFANILIPHDTYDPQRRNDLYPKDFIIDLPRPNRYFGAEELFGITDVTGIATPGLDVVRDISDQDIQAADSGQMPPSLEIAILDFVLAGATRALRGQGEQPATMLVHISSRIEPQISMTDLIRQCFSDIRDQWRYQRSHGIQNRLQERWEQDFQRVTHESRPDREVNFNQIEKFIGAFLESVDVRTVNSATGDILDYEREPHLKAIAVGGNKLSRGLTLEGLVVSYFIRRSVMYDTLMQMGRWFGFREGYEDLTRIYTTAELAGWFADLALAEHRLREDLRVYDDMEMTPREVGMRIWQHPTMQVTSPMKRRFATNTTITQSYSGQFEQTFRFPLRRIEDLATQSEANRISVRNFLASLGKPDGIQSDRKGPVWVGISPDRILGFLRSYQTDPSSRSISTPLICDYIERANQHEELIRWVVAIRGREQNDALLGEADWGIEGRRIYQISRTRLIKNIDSVGVITEPRHEAVGLSEELREQMDEHIKDGDSDNVAARKVRPPEEGLLLLYPISRQSGYERERTEPLRNRSPLYDDPNGPLARDLVGLAISFPWSNQPQQVEEYLEGTVGWRRVE